LIGSEKVTKTGSCHSERSEESRVFNNLRDPSRSLSWAYPSLHSGRDPSWNLPWAENRDPSFHSGWQKGEGLRM